jgi:hypothetical protein
MSVTGARKSLDTLLLRHTGNVSMVEFKGDADIHKVIIKPDRIQVQIYERFLQCRDNNSATCSFNFKIAKVMSILFDFIREIYATFRKSNPSDSWFVYFVDCVDKQWCTVVTSIDVYGNETRRPKQNVMNIIVSPVELDVPYHTVIAFDKVTTASTFESSVLEALGRGGKASTKTILVNCTVITPSLMCRVLSDKCPTYVNDNAMEILLGDRGYESRKYSSSPTRIPSLLSYLLKDSPTMTTTYSLLSAPGTVFPYQSVNLSPPLSGGGVKKTKSSKASCNFGKWESRWMKKAVTSATKRRQRSKSPR